MVRIDAGSYKYSLPKQKTMPRGQSKILCLWQTLQIDIYQKAKIKLQDWPQMLPLKNECSMVRLPGKNLPKALFYVSKIISGLKNKSQAQLKYLRVQKEILQQIRSSQKLQLRTPQRKYNLGVCNPQKRQSS